jgi:hypothetical protein
MGNTYFFISPYLNKSKFPLFPTYCRTIGEVTSTNLNIVLVEINSEIAVARLYETDGSIPETDIDDNIYNSYLFGRDNGDDVYTIFFNSYKIQDDPWWGC